MKILRLNEEVTFGQKGSIKEYAKHGWSLDEDNPSYTWTNDLEAGIHFNAQASNANLTLKLIGLPYLGEGKMDCQRAWVHLNGMYCGIFTVSDSFEVSVPLRGTWMEPRSNLLTLTIPNAKSPKELGIGADQRRLGLALRSMVMAQA